MPANYDLVVIGGSPEGRFAAQLAAVDYGQRVALVEQYPPPHIWSSLHTLYSNVLSHSQQEQIPAPLLRGREIVANFSPETNLETLAAVGVDVIRGQGEFCRRPRPAFLVNNRRLQSRSYLIATGSKFTLPNRDYCKTIGGLTPHDIWTQETLANLPQNLVIIGENILSIELAQSLQKLGKKITLVVEGSRILSQEDQDVSRLIQSQLEVEGVNILTSSPITQGKMFDSHKWLQVGNQAIETDEVIWTNNRIGNLENLNLEAVQVQWNDQGIPVNRKQQTSNSHIYACGDVVSKLSTQSELSLALAQYEATIAVKNALLFPWDKVNHSQVPCTSSTIPPFAKIGITETQGKQQNSNKIEVISQDFKSLAQGQICNQTTGFCKLILGSGGKILGAVIVGSQSREYIGMIALAISENLTLKQLANSPMVIPSFSEIIHQIAQQWHRENRSSLTKFLEAILLKLRR